VFLRFFRIDVLAFEIGQCLYTLVVLKDLGVDPASKEARKMIDRVDKRRESRRFTEPQPNPAAFPCDFLIVGPFILGAFLHRPGSSTRAFLFTVPQTRFRELLQ